MIEHFFDRGDYLALFFIAVGASIWAVRLYFWSKK